MTIINIFNAVIGQLRNRIIINGNGESFWVVGFTGHQSLCTANKLINGAPAGKPQFPIFGNTTLAVAPVLGASCEYVAIVRKD